MGKLKNLENIRGHIYHIRGQQVMLDSTLAELYGVSAKRLNEQVRRNLSRFPSDFMFKLSSDEEKVLRSQFATLKHAGSGRHRKYRPYVFTEQGVAMLSGVLHSPRAIEVNIAIMRAFIKLRRALSSSQDITRRVEKLEGKVNMHGTDIGMLVQAVIELRKQPAHVGPIDPEIL